MSAIAPGSLRGRLMLQETDDVTGVSSSQFKTLLKHYIQDIRQWRADTMPTLLEQVDSASQIC